MTKKNPPATTPTALEDEAVKLPDVLPVLPLKDAVIFPYVIVPLSVGRDKSVLAVDQALADNRLILLLTQHDPATEEPKPEDLHTLGTAGLIYGAGAVVLSAAFVLLGVRVLRDDGDRAAKQMFGFSILYLFLLFALMIVDSGHGPLAATASLAGGLR